MLCSDGTCSRSFFCKSEAITRVLEEESSRSQDVTNLNKQLRALLILGKVEAALLSFGPAVESTSYATGVIA
jgi:hypothetical protein